MGTCGGAKWHRGSILGSHLAFDSRRSQKFLSILLRFFDGTGYRKIDRGLKLLIEPV